jgi:hypothetical protein
MGKLHITHTAIGLDYRQRIESSPGITIAEVSKMPPVDLHLFAWRGFKAYKGCPVFYLPPYLLKVIPNNGNLSVKSLALKALEDHRGTYLGVLHKKLIDELPVGLQL